MPWGCPLFLKAPVHLSHKKRQSAALAETLEAIDPGAIL